MADPNILLYEGYQDYFDLNAGFTSSGGITSTTFEIPDSFSGYRYTAFFGDGSKIVFNMGDKNSDNSQPASFDNIEHYHFSTDADGNRILDHGGSFDFTIFDPDGSKVVQSTSTVPGSISVFSDHFLDIWLAGNNDIAPDEPISTDQVLHGHGGRDNLIGGGGDDTIFLDVAGATHLGGGQDLTATGNDTFVILKDVIVAPDSQRGVTIAGTDLNTPSAPIFGEINTIEARGNNDFSLADIFWINRIVFNGARSLDFGGGNFDGYLHVTPNSTIVGDDGPNRLTVWMNPADMGHGHGNANGAPGLNLSALTFKHWTEGTDRVIIMADAKGLAGTPTLFAPKVDTEIVGGLNEESLIGNEGDDIISGGGGDDVIAGHAGRDVLAGNAGSDTFMFFLTSDSKKNAAKSDTIDHFQHGADKIDVHFMDANTATKADDTFDYIGEAAFTHAAQIRAEQHGSDVWLQFNTHGKSGTDMLIVLEDTAMKNLDGNDFAL